MQHAFKHALGTLALAAAVACGGPHGRAEAAFVVVNVDPVFGPDRPNLGWRASGAMYVPDSCKNAASAFASGPVTLMMYSDHLCDGAHLENVKVEFYDTRDARQATIETLLLGNYVEDTGTGAYGGTAGQITQSLVDITFDAGQVVAFSTTDSYFYSAASALAAPVPSTDYALGLNLALPAERPSLVAPLSGTVSSSDTYLLSRNDYGTAQSNSETITLSSYISDADFNGVPEPGSLALALAGLGAAGWLGGRKARSGRSGRSGASKA